MCSKHAPVCTCCCSSLRLPIDQVAGGRAELLVLPDDLRRGTGGAQSGVRQHHGGRMHAVHQEPPAPHPPPQLALFTACRKSCSVTVCRRARMANMPASVQMLQRR